MHRDNRDAVPRSCRFVSFSWLSRCDMFSFVHRLSLRSVRREDRAHVSFGLSFGAVCGSFVSVASWVRRVC